MLSLRTNTLLKNLPTAEFERLSSHMSPVTLSKGQTLFDLGQRTAHVYYPVDAIVSMMQDLADGHSVETYMLSRSFMVGLGAIKEPSFYRAHVRSTGLAYRMSVASLQRESAQCPEYTQAVEHGLHRMVKHLSIGMACSKRHPVEQQFMRWLLITLDRTESPVIAMTHQELSDLLGFRREAITLAIGKLARAGSLRHGRGVIEVIDRLALEQGVCDCYWMGQEKTPPWRTA